MAKKRRRRRRSPLPAIVCLLVVGLIVAAAGLIFNSRTERYEQMDLKEYYGFTSDEQAAIMVDDRILDEYGYVRDGMIYITYEMADKYFNESFYWDTASNQLLLTLPEGTQTWSDGDGTGTVLMVGDTRYISAECIRDNSDIDMEIYSDPYRVVARTKWTNVAAETVTEDTVIRSRSTAKSEMLTSVKQGDTVVLTENGDDWVKVATADGLIGYIRKNSIEAAPEGTISHTTDEKFVLEKLLLDKKVCLSWLYIDSEDGNNILEAYAQNAQGMNVISPTWFEFENAKGDIHSFATKDFVDRAHAMGFDVWGAILDVYGGEVSTGSLLLDYETREHIIDQLLTIAEKTGMDGINVDLETITAESAEQYLQFLRELSVAAHKKNIVISVDNYVPAYTLYLDRAEQARWVDYLIIMGYDEHSTFSEEPGSVASLPFVEQGIKDTLNEAPKEQVINAIPFYCRGWTTILADGSLQSEAYSMDDADQWAKNRGIEVTWDQATGQFAGSSEDGTCRYNIWMEEEKSIEEKLKLVRKYDLAGVGFWRLGIERDGVWKIISEYVK